MSRVEPFTEWTNELSRAINFTWASGMDGKPYEVEAGVEKFRGSARLQDRIIILGNGGSLATAMHIAADYNLAGWPTIALSDPVAFSSHTNDFGDEAGFAKQLELMKIKGGHDLVIGLSCSGKSKNVIEAIQFATRSNVPTVTFSGFAWDNPLRKMGTLNFFTPSHVYGHVQLAHEAILHAAVDLTRGWK
jgi:D-sedoheptulose 7-phosphate isomerase